MSESRLRCRWCGWSTAASFTARQGVRKSGWPKLEAHQVDCHPDEIGEVEAKSRERDAARPRTMDDPR